MITASREQRECDIERRGQGEAARSRERGTGGGGRGVVTEEVRQDESKKDGHLREEIRRDKRRMFSEERAAGMMQR